jgi:hypothetical protein
MAEQATKEQAAEQQSESQEARKNERSTIQFPYITLEEAYAIAKGVHTVGGSSCQVDQLAAHLDQKPDSGSFRLKLATTKMFGLITYSRGTASLTALGARICDPQQEQAAKADSFLSIPLYQKVYEQFKGASLPPLAGLEAAMVTMGVAQKQKSVARQVFHRSATFAGFFWSNRDRLVYPPIKGSTALTPAVEPNTVIPEGDKEQERSDRKKGNGGGGGDGSDGDYHPFIAGLLKTLPPADSDWPMDARRKWLQAASHIFEVIYKDSESKGSLRIEVQKDSAK